MATFRAQVVFPYFTNFPTDVMTNTWHFFEFAPVGLSAAASAITPLLADFYETCYQSSRPMAQYVQPPLAKVNWYDLSAPPPRVPITLPLGAVITVGSTTIPTEVAIVASFQGVPVTGVPQARRRGRIYLGGMVPGHFQTSSASAFPTVIGAQVSAINTAMMNLKAAVLLTALRWAVWSPTDGTSTEIANGWVDNSPDTQRRRSVDPTARTIWP